MIYLIGSLKNPNVPIVGNLLRAASIDAFDGWYAPGPNADDHWRDYEKSVGRTYAQALYGHAARHIFDFDVKHLNRATACVLVAPAGKSAHLELGWMLGKGKPGYVLFDKEPERWDVMYQFATAVYFSLPPLIEELKHAGLHERQANGAESVLRDNQEPSSVGGSQGFSDNPVQGVQIAA